MSIKTPAVKIRHGVVCNFRNFLKRQGYVDVVVRQVEPVPSSHLGDVVYSVSAYDQISEHYFSRARFTLFDMQCVLHSNDVFWRFVK